MANPSVPASDDSERKDLAEKLIDAAQILTKEELQELLQAAREITRRH